ncbi:MAG: hypothetical protein ACLS29_08240 [Prevotellamassilia sp.]
MKRSKRTLGNESALSHEIADYTQGATHFLTEKPLNRMERSLSLEKRSSPTGEHFFSLEKSVESAGASFFPWKIEANRRDHRFFREKNGWNRREPVFFGGKWEVIRVQGLFYARQCKLSSHEPSFTQPKNPTNGL